MRGNFETPQWGYMQGFALRQRILPNFPAQSYEDRVYQERTKYFQ